MSRNFRIPPTKSINDRNFPVNAFFNAIPDRDFIEMLEYMVDGMGYNYNGIEYAFPDSIDPWEEPFEGMRFTAVDRVLVLNYKEAYMFLQQACRVYIEDRPNDKVKVEQLLKKFFDKYCR